MSSGKLNTANTASLPASEFFAAADFGPLHDPAHEPAAMFPMLTEAHYPELPEWLRELYPFRTRTLAIDGQRMSFVDEGPSDAPAMLLLHGNPTWSFLYRDLIRRLKDSYRVIAPDHIGFGLSDKPVNAQYYTLSRHISNLARLMEVLDLQKFTLVAHGWGGPIGLGYAVANPTKITSLVLANTWVANLANARQLRLPLGRRIAALGRIGFWLDRLLNLSMQSMFSSRALRAMGDLALEAYTYPFPKAASRAGIVAFNRMFFGPDRETLDKLMEINAGLKDISAPAAILYGEQDSLLSKLPAYLLRDQLPHSREPVFLPDVSHCVPEEAPEAMAETVLKAQAAEKPADSVFKIIP